MIKLENDQRNSTEHSHSNIIADKDQFLKEISKNDEKIKEIIERNERLENECLKFKIQVKSLEDKLSIKKEKEYFTNTDTSSNFILPSEFRKCWEDFANKDLSDCFIDFYDHPIEAFQLIQQFIYLCIEILDEQIEIILNGILTLLNLPRDKNLNKIQIENALKPIFKENYQFIFDSENISEIYFTQLKQKFQEFYKNNLKNSEKNDEFEDLISSRSFKNSVANIKKIVFYLKFNGEQLQFKIDNINERKKEIKTFNKNECICVQGFLKIPKNCLVLLSPPIMKNGYPYQNLKPIVIEYDGEISDKTIEEITHTQASRSKEEESRTEHIEENFNKTARQLSGNNRKEENEKSNLSEKAKSEINQQEENTHGENIIHNEDFIDNIHSNASLANSPKNKVLGMSSSQKYLINYKLSADILLSISEIDHKLTIENNSSNGEKEKNDNIKSHRVISKAKKSVINKIKSLTVTPNDKLKEEDKEKNITEVNKNLLQNKSNNFKNKLDEKSIGEAKNNNKQTVLDLIKNSTNDSNPNTNDNNIIKYSQINLNEILLTPDTNNNQATLKQKENKRDSHHLQENLNNQTSQYNPKIKKERNFIKTNLDILFKEKNNFFEKESKPQNKSTLQENCDNIYSSRSQIDFNIKDKQNFNYLTEYDMANIRIAIDNENNFKNAKEYITSDSLGAPSINAINTNGIYNSNVNSNSTFKFYNKKHKSKNSDNLVDIIDSLESEINLEKENRGEIEITKDLNMFFSQSINKNSTQASTLKNYNLDSDKIINKSEKNFMNNSHKKNTNKGTMFIFQTTDRSSENNINAVNDKQNKNTSQYFRTGVNKITGGSLSKTPKFQKQGLDSPREFTTNTILFNNYAKSGTGMDKSLKERRENNLNNYGDFLPGKNLNHQFSNSNNIGNYSASFHSQKTKNSSKKNKISNVDDSENSYEEKPAHQNFDDNISRGGLTSPKQRNFSDKLKENLTKKKKTNNFLISNIKAVQSSTLNHVQSMNSYNSTLNLHSSTSINMHMLTKNKNKANTKSKGFDDENNSNKRKLIQKESSVNKQPINRSIDRKIFENRTNAEIKINVDELLSVKRGEKSKESPAIKELSRVKSSKDGLNIAKTHYLNIKYV